LYEIITPKSSRIDHVKKNRVTLDLKLSAVELATLDQAFSTPNQPVPLEMWKCCNEYQDQPIAI
jgi:diketogulonate reductase-like aldo/keto reductase